jgi:hypothetical protein
MPIYLPVKAAGRTLTVGELSEALSGLADNDPVTISGHDILVADASAGGGIDFDFGHDCEGTRAWDLLCEIADGEVPKAQMLNRIKSFVGENKAA